MADNATVEAPPTLEGWYVLHDVYAFDWTSWYSLDDEERGELSGELSAWLGAYAAVDKGDSAAFSVIGHKGDLMFVHYRESPDTLAAVERSLRSLAFNDLLLPAYSYLSVIEVGLYEAMAMAALRLGERGIERGSKEFDEAFGDELETQKEKLSSRLYADVPTTHYICFYPMSKRRGESVNWYTLPLEERRRMMRGHGSIGHKWAGQVTQVIGGSVGLDDWEWGVSLYADDPLVFKKLVYEMRFDEASAKYAEFGPFYVGVRHDEASLANFLAEGESD